MLTTGQQPAGIWSR